MLFSMMFLWRFLLKKNHPLGSLLVGVVSWDQIPFFYTCWSHEMMGKMMFAIPSGHQLRGTGWKIHHLVWSFSQRTKHTKPPIFRRSHMFHWCSRGLPGCVLTPCSTMAGRRPKIPKTSRRIGHHLVKRLRHHRGIEDLPKIARYG